MRAETLKGHLDLLLLSVVAPEPAHGYALIVRLKIRSEGAFNLGEGTVYPALHRLEKAGLLESEWSEDKGRKRRVYRLSRKGRKAMEDRKTEWREFVEAMTLAMRETT